MSALPLIPHIVCLLLAVAAGLWQAERLRRARPDVDAENALRHLPHLWVLSAIGGVIVPVVYWIITRPIGVQAAFPLGLVDAAPLVLWGTLLLLFGYLFALTVRLAYATAHAQRHALLVAALLGVAAIEVAHGVSTTPLWPALTERLGADGEILQSSGASCAAASGANIAASFGMAVTEADVARAMGTTGSGTSTAQMVHGMRELGIECEPFSLDPGDPAAMPAPSIVFVPVGDVEDGHAIALLGHDDGHLDLIDPLVGRMLRTPEDVVGHWGGRGVHCQPSR